MKKIKAIFLILSIILTVFSANAQLSLSPILGSNMVMQRNSEVKIWGKSNSNTKVKISTGWNKAVATVNSDEKGNWMVSVKTTGAGGPYIINIESGKEKLQLENILLGEVWICSGQSNMEMPMQGYGYQPVNGSSDALFDADNENLRLFTVKKAPKATPQDLCEGKWDVANGETAAKFSAVGYYYARLLQQKLNIPVGIICSSVGGTPIEAWMSSKALGDFPEQFEKSKKSSVEQSRANHLYNGMIHPLVNYTIKGVIWYQAESNRKDYKYYAALLDAMVRGWRTDFGVGEFPFYYVQIAPYSYGNSSEVATAFMREAQLKAMASIPNSGMVCTMDIGSEGWIHPPEKQIVGKRLASWALAETYGFKGIPYKSPTYKSMEVKDNIVTISFNDAQVGMTSFDKSVDCFELAGADKIFYPAKMTLISSEFRKVQVVSDKVPLPVALRYAFKNYPKTDGYLFGVTGLPVPSFRTDDY